MRSVYWLLSIAACVSTGLFGLAAGINLNPGSTVKFVPVLDADSWSAAGAWLGAIATFCAVVVSLHYSRRDDQEHLQLIIETHEKAGASSYVKMTFMAACTGRVPATILSMEIVGSAGAHIHVAQFATGYTFPECLERGRLSKFEITEDSLRSLASHLSALGEDPKRLKWSVRTALDTYEEPLTMSASALLSTYYESNR